MKYLKIFFLLVIVNLCSKLTFAQANHVYMTIIPTAVYPDTLVKIGIVEVQTQERNTSETQVTYETKTVTLGTTAPIGKASAVTTQERQNAAPAEKEKTPVKYQEQKVEKQEVPVNNSSLNPK